MKFYGYALAQESMPPVIKFTLFGHQYHILSLSGLCPGVVKKLTKKTNINVESPLPKKNIIDPWDGVGGGEGVSNEINHIDATNQIW